MPALINRLTRPLTDAEALHLLTRTWGYRRGYSEMDADERKQSRREDANKVRLFVAGMFQKQGVDVPSFDEHFDGEGAWPLLLAVKGFNYLHKIGALK